MVTESALRPKLGCTEGESPQLPLPLSEQLAQLLKEGAETPADEGALGELPAWFDYDKFRRGQSYFRHNYYALFVSKLSGLLAVLAIPSILRVLVLTKQSADPAAAFRRYMATLSHMLSWYDGDLLDPASRAHQSLRLVTGKHCAASRQALRTGVGRISQLDMALTQFGFMGFAVLSPDLLGLHGDDADVEGYVHFWRTVGHLLGIQDRFNLCRESVQETRALCLAVRQSVFVPALRAPAPPFREMARALLLGMWAMVPAIDEHAFLAFTYRLAGLRWDELDGRPSGAAARAYSKAVLALQIFVHQILTWRFLAWLLRPILNFQMWLAVFLTQRYQLLAIAAFGSARLK